MFLSFAYYLGVQSCVGKHCKFNPFSQKRLIFICLFLIQVTTNRDSECMLQATTNAGHHHPDLPPLTLCPCPTEQREVMVIHHFPIKVDSPPHSAAASKVQGPIFLMRLVTSPRCPSLPTLECLGENCRQNCRMNFGVVRSSHGGV